MKKAKANGIAAIYVACPECGGDCENARGSLLVTPEDTEVSCVSCVQTWEVSANAFGKAQRSKVICSNCSDADCSGCHEELDPRKREF